MIIGFEGLDGTGKTSIAAAVSEVLGGTGFSTWDVPAELVARRRAVNKSDDVEARFEYFLHMNALHLDLAQRRPERLVAIDSTAYRTVATHRVLGSIGARQTVVSPDMLPDLVVYLDAREEVRHARLMARDGGTVAQNHWDQQLNECQGALRDEYEQFGLPRVDANGSVEAVVAQVIALV